MERATEKKLLASQRDEITEHLIYKKLYQATKDPHNKDIFKSTASDELSHYNIWKEYTHQDVKPDKLKIFIYCLISRVIGVTFGIKLMEGREAKPR